MDLLSILKERKQRELAMLAQKLEELTAKMEQVRGDLDALSRSIQIARSEGLTEDSGGAAQAPSPPADKPDAGAAGKPPEEQGGELDGNTTDRVRQVLPRLQRHFTTGQVRDRLNEADPAFLEQRDQSVLSHALRRMVQRGELRIVQAGGPNRETTFERMGV